MYSLISNPRLITKNTPNPRVFLVVYCLVPSPLLLYFSYGDKQKNYYQYRKSSILQHSNPIYIIKLSIDEFEQ